MSRRLALAGALVVTACAPQHHHGPVMNLIAAQDPATTTTTSTAVSSTTTSRPDGDRRAPARGSRNAARPRTGVTPAGAGVATGQGAGGTHLARVSWYAQGARTANGDHYNPDGLTFANRTMRFGTRIRFCRDGRCVDATCTDRGPAAWTHRDFDLSRGAFSAIAPLGAGVIDVAWSAA